MYTVNNTEYKLLFLDTNVFREFFQGKDSFYENFLKKFFIENTNYIICFSIINVFELKPHEDVYQKFLDFFDIMPCIMFYLPFSMILKEYNVYKGEEAEILNHDIMSISSPAFRNNNLKLRGLLFEQLNKFDLQIKTMIKNLDLTVKDWKQQRANSMLKSVLNKQYKIDIKHFLNKELDIVRRDIKNFTGKDASNADITYFPSIRLMEYTQFNKVYLSKKEIVKNDAMDVTMSCIIPYVDAVITENQMGDLYKQAGRHIKQLKDLEIYNLKDFKNKHNK